MLSAIRTSRRRARALLQLARARKGIDTNLAERLAHWAKRRPGHKALWFEGQTWSFREVDALVQRRAAALHEWGVRRGQAVALLMDNRPEFIFNALALSRLGAVSALINCDLTGAGLRHAVAIAEPVAAIVGGEHLDIFRAAFSDRDEAGGLDALIDWERTPQAEPTGSETDFRGLVARSAATRVPTYRPRADDLAAYIYTSGTTGLPKAGKILNARCSIAGLGFGAMTMALGRDDVVYCCLPLFHSNGFLVAMASALYNGATFALARRLSVSHFWQDVRESGATVFVYIGEVCRYLTNQPPQPTDGQHNLRCVVGNGLRPEVWAQFEGRFRPGRIHEFYGATEGNVNMVNFWGRFGSVGKLPRPVDNTLLVQFDRETQLPRRNARGLCVPCKPGEVGELLGEINGKLVSQRFDGYADAAATESKVLHNVRKHGDAYFRSGDLLKQDRKGYYYFVDRIGDTFRWKGENVSTNEVGDAIQAHSAVEIANVYGVKVGQSDGRAGMVTVLPHDGAKLDTAALYRHVAATLPAFARPAFLRLAQQVSLTATFKLRKVELVKDGFDPAKVDDPLFYRDDKAETYKPLTPEAYKRILAGKIRF